MGRQPCCDKVGLKKGPWTAEEDKRLINFILSNGQCCWRAVPKLAGLLRCGKSCRLRWTNYLRPDLKRGLLSEAEERLVIELHSQLGNRWSKIASHLPGRTDNEIKNHWNTHIKKKLRRMGIDPLTHKPILLPPAVDGMQKMEASSDCSPLLPEEQIDGDHALFLSNSPGFSTDEVPMIQPHEIVVPCASSTSSASSSSSCSSSNSDSRVEWPPESMNYNLWSLDDLNGWDFFTDIHGDEKLGLEPSSQCQRSALHQESWKFELF